MDSLKAIIRRYSIQFYYVLTFLISWGGILLAVGGPGGIPGTPEEFERFFPLVVLAMLGGPAFAGLLMTGVVYGKTGFRDLISRLHRSRRRLGLTEAALLIAPPLLMTAIPLVISIFRPEYAPRIFTVDDTSGVLRLGIMAGLGAGPSSCIRSSSRRGSCRPSECLWSGPMTAPGAYS